MSKKIELLDEACISRIFTRFQKANPAPKTELLSKNPFTLLVSVVLSAQATDKSVNKATENLYKTVQNPAQMYKLGEEGLIEHIKSIGLYRSKAKHIMELCRALIDEYGENAGEIEWENVKKLNTQGFARFPRTRQEFEKLSGVGRKSASVCLNVLYDEHTMPVDTHLLRISPRIGLSNGTKPLEVEKDLLQKIPDIFLDNAHHWLVLHGRYVCTARKPHCTMCLINDLCKKNGIQNEL